MKLFRFFSLLVMFCSSCGSGDKKLTFVVPKNFSGVFLVSEAKLGGHPMVGNNINLEVGADRRVLVENLKYFEKWHSIEVRKHSGEVITPDSGSHKNLYNLGFIPNEGIYFFFGESQVYDEIKKVSELSDFLQMDHD
jgi:hypothetical protein